MDSNWRKSLLKLCKVSFLRKSKRLHWAHRCRVHFCDCVYSMYAHRVRVYLVLSERHNVLQIVFFILKLNNPLIEFLTDGSSRPLQYGLKGQ